jgi:hypothetical protein
MAVVYKIIDHKNEPSQNIGSRLPVKSFWSVQIEWKGNVSKRDIHANKTHQSTYRVNEVSSRSSLGMEQDKPVHVKSNSQFKDVISPSSLGMEPVSSCFSCVQIEWQENMSKFDIHANKTHQSTYRATGQSTNQFSSSLLTQSKSYWAHVLVTTKCR